MVITLEATQLLPVVIFAIIRIARKIEITIIIFVLCPPPHHQHNLYQSYERQGRPTFLPRCI